MAAVVAAALAANALGVYGQTNTTWIGPANGSWATAANWSGGVVPNNGGTRFNVFIDGVQAGNSTALLHSGAMTVNNLSISAGDQLTLANGTSINHVGNDVTGALSNAGTILLTSTGGATAFNFNTGSTGLGGGGTITLSGAARIGGTGTLNNADNTILGIGSVGMNAAHVINAGTIAAVGAGSLSIDPSTASGMVNTGTMLADSGATLRFLAGTVSGAGGDIIARSGGTVSLLSSAVLSGQTFNTVGTGVMQSTADCTTSDFTNLGNFQINTGINHLFNGTNSNSGSFTVAANSDFELTGGGAVTLGGGGMVSLTASDSRILGVGTLVTDNTIHGTGQIGLNQTSFLNSGTIRADIAGGTLTIDAGAGGVLNSGTLVASGGGNLVIQATNVTNTTGRIEALAGSIVVLTSSSAITGGTLGTSGDGIIRPGNSSSVFLSDLSNTGNYHAVGGSNSFFSGTITNSGTFTVGATSDLDLNGGGTATFAGGGTIVLAAGDARLLGVGTLLSDNTIRGQGQIGVGQMNLRNTNLLVADVPAATLTLDPPGGGGAFVNTGTFAASNGGNLVLTSGEYDNTSGRFHAMNGSTISLISSAVISNGTFMTSGTGVIRNDGANATIRDITNVGHFVVSNGVDNFIQGTINNLGSFTIASTVTNADFEVTGGGTVTLSGGGTVNMQNASRLLGVGTLVTDNFIHGTGQIGVGQTSVRNSGVISADVNGGTLTLDPPVSAPIFNSGRMQAANGGILRITSGTINLSGGTIEALGGSTVSLLSSSVITGGTLATDAAGVIGTAASSTTTLLNVTNAGNFEAGGSSNTLIQGTIVNSGTFSIPANSDFELTGGGTVTLSGAGRLNLAASNTRVLGVGTLVSDNLIRGQGQVGVNQMSLINSGVVAADVPGGGIGMDAPGAVPFVNTGVFRAANGGTMTFLAGTYNSTGGAYEALAGSTITFASSAVVTGGNATVNGTLVNSSAAGVSVGNVTGSGSVLNTTGAIAAAHYRVGTLSAGAGTIAVTTNGTDSGASKVDNLILTGAARLDLTDNDLVVTTTPQSTVIAHVVNARNFGDWNLPGITSSAAKNHASQTTTLGVLSGAEYESVYGAGTPFSGLTIAATDTLVKYTWYGDTDFNGFIDGDDYARTDSGFNLGFSGWLNGDADMNGFVDGDDYALIDAAFNTQNETLRRAQAFLSGDDRSRRDMNSNPALARVLEHFDQFGVPYAQHFLAAVPEPACVPLLAAGLLQARRRRR
jgi:hypothetical protein